ncbi:MAG: aminoglycoside adenylyltransferase [Chloroflexi bacterium RBG_16_54_18]|nr:MAG: aminoglycoside adenylyltransferase [Chloroflexi bacterium RBG_16_54_18]
MRSESEVLDLIVNTARDDDRIRAVILNGSRANPGSPRDIFQDFDIVYIVTDVGSFTADAHWIERFGEMMVLQMPDDMHEPPPDKNAGFAYLMQFTDGNRIDLNLYPLARLDEREKDSLSLLLLDKDGLLGTLPPASEIDYLPKPPTSKAFSDCCNEFWWVCPYVAKGLWRGEIAYARYMFDQVVRDQLMKMLVWYIGVKTQFSVNPGKFGRYFASYLEPELWELLLQTYSDAGIENTWQALFTMCDLFRTAAKQVAAHFGFDYPFDDDHRVSAHLEHVRLLPRDAQEIY